MHEEAWNGGIDKPRCLRILCLVSCWPLLEQSQRWGDCTSWHNPLLRWPVCMGTKLLTGHDSHRPMPPGGVFLKQMLHHVTVLGFPLTPHSLLLSYLSLASSYLISSHSPLLLTGLYAFHFCAGYPLCPEGSSLPCPHSSLLGLCSNVTLLERSCIRGRPI